METFWYWLTQVHLEKWLLEWRERVNYTAVRYCVSQESCVVGLLWLFACMYVCVHGSLSAVMHAPLSCINAKACLAGWPNA